MAADVRNREQIRDAIAAGLTTALTGAGPVQTVYGYKYRGFKGESPVVLVLSGGSDRSQWGLGSQKARTHFRIELLVFVADPVGVESWTDAMVEDRLDLIDKEIYDWLADNRAMTGVYAYVDTTGISELYPAQVGGEPYTMERILLDVEAFDA